MNGASAERAPGPRCEAMRGQTLPLLEAHEGRAALGRQNGVRSFTLRGAGRSRGRGLGASP